MQLAAIYAVMPISCGNEDQPDLSLPLQDGLNQYFGQNNMAVPYWVGAQLGRKWNYAQKYTEVTLAAPADIVNLKYAQNEDLVVTVRHTFYLAIPYARRIFSLDADGVKLDLGNGLTEYGTNITATCRLSNEGVQDYVDVEKFP